MQKVKSGAPDLMCVFFSHPGKNHTVEPNGNCALFLLLVLEYVLERAIQRLCTFIATPF
jgi:hypothetical protein